MSKILVSYFSASGITREVALKIAKILGADSYEIMPQTPYSKADLDWNDESSRSTLEMKDKASRPKLAPNTQVITPDSSTAALDISAYGTIFVGFPVWWYSCPHVILSFLEAHDFSNKIIVPFCTSGGSDLSGAPRDMQGSAPKASFKEGKKIDFGEGNASLRRWLEGLGL